MKIIKESRSKATNQSDSTSEGNLTMNKLLHFEGPYSFFSGCNCLFEKRVDVKGCIYLWTFRQNNEEHLVHYVGQSKDFVARHKQHLASILGLEYAIFDADAAKNGKLLWLWDGLWRKKDTATPTQALCRYKSLAPKVIDYIGSLNVFVGAIDLERIQLCKIEGLLAQEFRKDPDCSKLYPCDNRTGVGAKKHGMTLEISPTNAISGLPTTLEL